MKRLAILLVTITLIIGTASSEIYAGAPASMKVSLYSKPDISVTMNGVRKEFRDVNGQRIYPLIYNGTTYLPVRAVSALMREPVEWDGGFQTVFIGKTLSYPDKVGAPIPVEAAVTADDEEDGIATPSLVTGYLKPDILVMYDFDFQSFQDAYGNTVYPIIYNGSTYLPVRAVSKLMGASIKWNGTEKLISIKLDGIEEHEPASEPEKQISEASLQLKALFEQEEILYYEATANIASLQSAFSLEDKQSIASKASENYLSAQAMTQKIKATDQTDFTNDEQTAYENLVLFAESNEGYSLILENIAYLAASEQDYSMLADTFLYYAGDAKTKMDGASDYIRFITTAD